MGTSQSRRFEFRQGNSKKFWTISVDGDAFTVTYGRIGADGKTQEKSFADATKAKAAAEKLIAQKVGKGYKEVKPKQMAGGLNKAERKEHQPFWDEILEDLSNPDSFSVYSDWLTEQGDPRGEFIRIQLRLEDESIDKSDRKSLKSKEKSLITKHRREWLGEPLAEFFIDQVQPEDADWFEPSYSVDFERGILLSLKCELGDPQFPAAFDQHTANFVVALDVKDVHYEDDGESVGLLSKLSFPACRRLSFGGVRGGTDATNLDRLVKKMPQLKKLDVSARTDSEVEAIFRLKLPELESLSLDAGYVYPLDVLGRNRSLSKLEELHIEPHMLEPGDDKSYVTGFQGFCKSKHLVSLRRLKLTCTEFGDEGVAQLVKAPFFPQLKVLRLFSGTITVDGLAVLAEQDLSNLESLDVTQNYIHGGDDLAKQIRQQLPKFKLGFQINGNPGEGEFEHLNEGSME